jgi:hypothetical protein
MSSKSRRDISNQAVAGGNTTVQQTTPRSSASIAEDVVEADRLQAEPPFSSRRTAELRPTASPSAARSAPSGRKTVGRARMTLGRAIPAGFADPLQRSQFSSWAMARDWNLRVVLNRIEKDLRRAKDARYAGITWRPFVT